MLKKIYRLRTTYVNKLIRNKSFFNTHVFTIKYLKNNLQINRYAISISNKVSKKAVIRNIIKRNFYSLIKCYNKTLDNNYDFLFILKSENNKIDKNKLNSLIIDIKNDIQFFFNKFCS